MNKTTEEVNTAYFIIADITGYTKFMSETAIEHASKIIEALFSELVPTIRAPLAISGLQGDAIFAYALESDVMTKQFILDFAEQLYSVFARSKEKMIINTSCTCDACSNMQVLELKLVVHHGQFMKQKTADREELAGQGVITAFRLLKNSVAENTGLKAYSLISCDALKAMDLTDFFEDSEFYSEDIEHIGQVEYVVRDMQAAWERRRKSERVFVELNDKLLTEEWIIPLPVPPEIAFVICTRPDLRQEWLDASRIEVFDTANGKIEPGTKYHCYHGDALFPFEILDWMPGEYMTGRYNLAHGVSMLETDEITQVGDGSLLKLRFTVPKSSKFIGKFYERSIAKQIGMFLKTDKENRIERMNAIAAKLKGSTISSEAA